MKVFILLVAINIAACHNPDCSSTQIWESKWMGTVLDTVTVAAGGVFCPKDTVIDSFGVYHILIRNLDIAPCPNEIWVVTNTFSGMTDTVTYYPDYHVAHQIGDAMPSMVGYDILIQKIGTKPPGFRKK